MNAKKLLRKELKRRLLSLSENDKIFQSQYITERVLEAAEYQKSSRISVFLSMHDEVKTEGILKNILSSGKQCFIPKYVGSQMDMIKLHSWDDYINLPETSWKIKQPADDDNSRENALETGGLDLILMPGLGFSQSGDRLGRGKGYYDTYLKRCEEAMKKRPCTIALAYFEQMCESIPTSEHDVPVDKVLFMEKK